MAVRSGFSGADSTIVGPNSHIKGNIEGQENLEIAGRVEGSITVSEKVSVLAAAVVAADIEAREVEISGAVVGDVVAAESVVLHPGARLMGNIRSPRLTLADGAAFRGEIDMGEVSAVHRPVRVSAAQARRGTVGRLISRSTPAAASMSVPKLPNGNSKRRDASDITVVVRHSELAAGERAVGERVEGEASAAAPTKRAKKGVRARVPARGKRKAKAVRR
ncbi:MAG: polymer-forming cytoskeletal protein [Nannocystaceae bacterium]